MKKVILVVAVSFFVVSSYSQSELEEWKSSQDEYANFDIGKFITPDIVRSQLDFNFSFRSNNSRSDFSSPDRDQKHEFSFFKGDISTSFTHYVNTRKRISSIIWQN